jgi:hypothetical protein
MGDARKRELETGIEWDLIISGLAQDGKTSASFTPTSTIFKTFLSRDYLAFRRKVCNVERSLPRNQNSRARRSSPSDKMAGGFDSLSDELLLMIVSNIEDKDWDASEKLILHSRFHNSHVFL